LRGSYVKQISREEILATVNAQTFSASTDFRRVREVGAVIICVPTPLYISRELNISFIIQTGKLIAPHLAKGALVVFESTTYPGITDEGLREVLEAGSGMKAVVDSHPVFSQEREDPGNLLRGLWC
jgi:UDP-N-acetyl-D-glucosamine dehydrogenase